MFDFTFTLVDYVLAILYGYQEIDRFVGEKVEIEIETGIENIKCIGSGKRVRGWYGEMSRKARKRAM